MEVSHEFCSLQILRGGRAASGTGRLRAGETRCDSPLAIPQPTEQHGRASDFAEQQRGVDTSTIATTAFKKTVTDHLFSLPPCHLAISSPRIPLRPNFSLTSLVVPFLRFTLITTSTYTSLSPRTERPMKVEIIVDPTKVAAQPLAARLNAAPTAPRAAT